MSKTGKSGKRQKRIYTRCITKNGRRIYAKNGRVFSFMVDID